MIGAVDCNYVCEHLPRGWEIVVSLEKDAGDIQLYNPDGDEVEFQWDWESMYEKVQALVDYAIRAEAGKESL